MVHVPDALKPARPSRPDVGVAAFFAGLVVFEALTSGYVDNPWRHAVLGVPAMAALAWRRQFPLLVAFVVLVCNTLINPDFDYTIGLAFGLISYTVGRECGGARAPLGLVLLVGWFLVGIGLDSGELLPSDVAAAGVLIGGTWTIGQVVRNRSQLADEAAARADRLEREQELRSAAAAAEERVRLARELHDVVSHSISVVAVQAQAVRRRLRPDQHREIEDLAAVETTAREAMAELRRLFGVLRSDGEATPLAPQPGLAELDRLAESVRATGLRVEVTRTGEDGSLPAGLDLAAYRIVQEAVTNAMRHSGGTTVSVRVGRSPRELSLVVEDDGRGLDGDGPGHGLAGIRERAELYGGTLEIGDSSAGGVRVAALLPVESR